jgi:lipopolysaccharide/colanic/teichoic acid biosynthesis glycosyltransferase
MLVRTLRHDVAVSRKKFAKRMFDVCVSSALLLLTLPIIILTAILIYVESPGSVFCRRPKIGQFGCPFALLTFRSTYADTEADGAPHSATEKEARCTRVGQIIRKLCIDELPQLINVLWGEMSMVGPRPETPAFVKAMSRKFSHYSDRHTVKPGITGWAQTRYPHGNHNVRLDWHILAQTARLLLVRKDLAERRRYQP